jgi:uncharacterized protein YycO
MKLAFYLGSNGNYLDKLICIVTGSAYSHCELVFSDGQSFSSSPRDGGVRFKPIIYEPQKWVVIELPVEPADEAKVRSWCQTKTGKDYDFSGVLGFILPFFKQDDDDYYCSEICLMALKLVIEEWSKKRNKISPGKLFGLVSGLRGN